MSQPFVVTTLNLNGALLSSAGGVLLVNGSPVQGAGGGGGPLPSGVFQSHRINLRTTGIYPFITGIPSGYYYLIDSLECVFTNTATMSNPPSLALGTGSTPCFAQNIIPTTNMLQSTNGSGNQGDRYIWDVPLNAISGNAYLFVQNSGTASSPFSGVFICHGTLVNYVQ